MNLIPVKLRLTYICAVRPHNRLVPGVDLDKISDCNNTHIVYKDIAWYWVIIQQHKVLLGITLEGEMYSELFKP